MKDIDDYVQDHQINQARREHQMADGATTDALGTLASQIRTLQAEVARQSAALNVLTTLLLERGTVDGAELKRRFDAASNQAKAQANLVKCARCSKQVDKRNTQISESGVLCDTCHRALMLDE